jgi:hypothetical protein
MRRLGLLVPVVILPVALALGGCGSSAQDDDMGGAESAAEASTTAPTTASTPAGEAVLLEAPPDAGAGRCMAPSADVLSEADVAFSGTVRSIEHGLVDVEVDKWYRGSGGDVSQVRAQSGQMQALIGAVAFEEEGRFLVAGIDGELMVCGLSAAYDEQLAALYDEAFGG